MSLVKMRMVEEHLDGTDDSTPGSRNQRNRKLKHVRKRMVENMEGQLEAIEQENLFTAKEREYLDTNQTGIFHYTLRTETDFKVIPKYILNHTSNYPNDYAISDKYSLHWNNRQRRHIHPMPSPSSNDLHIPICPIPVHQQI